MHSTTVADCRDLVPGTFGGHEGQPHAREITGDPAAGDDQDCDPIRFHGKIAQMERVRCLPL